MFRQLIYLSLLFLGTLTAETIDNIEFQFPSKQNWNIEKEIVDSFGITTQKNYVLEDDYFPSIFRANFWHTPYVTKPEEYRLYMHQGIQVEYPSYNIYSNIVASDEDSVTMEIYAFKNENCKLYCLSRAIRSANGQVFLIYSSANHEHRSNWIRLILNAKPMRID